MKKLPLDSSRALVLSFVLVTFVGSFFAFAPQAEAGTYQFIQSWNEGECISFNFPNQCPSSPAGKSCTTGCFLNTTPAGGCPAGKARYYDQYECYAPEAFAGSCSMNPSSGPYNTGQTITRSVSVSGGAGTYAYTWSGTDSLSGSSASVQKSYSTTGSKTAQVKVVSPPPSRVFQYDSEEEIDSCPVTLQHRNNPCPSSNPTGQSCSRSCFVITANGCAQSPQVDYYRVKEYSCVPVSTQTTTISCPAINVVAPAQPDLTASGITPTATTVNAATTLVTTVSNGGNASTGASFTTLFQRATSAAGANATDIGTANTAAIAAGSSRTPTLSYTFTSTGTFYVRACADKSSATNNGVISESNENNNCGPWTAIGVGAAGGGSAPTVALSINGQNSSSSVTQGTQSTLSWSTTNATSCTASANPTNSGWNGSKATSGSQTTGASLSPGTYQYTLTCSGDGGSASDTVTLTITSAPSAPTVNLTINGQNSSSSVVQGTTSTLGWSTSNVTSCTASANPTNSGWNGSKATSGSQNTGSSLSPGTYQYTLTCSGDGGSTSDTITLTITPDSCANGATNPPSCTTCPGGYSMVGGVCVQNQPDLIASATTASPGSVTAGNATTLSGSITNQGNAAANSPDRTPTFNNWFQITPPGTASDANDDTFVNVTVTTPLAAGASQSVSKSSSEYSNPFGAAAPFSSAGNWQVRLCADTYSGGRVTESNENNNCGTWRTVTVSAPPASGVDLTITAQPTIAFADTPNSRFARVAHAQVQGEVSTLTATIWNFGDTATPTWYNNIFQVSRQSNFSSSSLLPATTGPAGHAPNASTQVTANWSPTGTGTWYVRACADNNDTWVDRVDESNEGNNCGPARTVSVSAPPASPTVSCTRSPASANTGATITWTATPSGFSGTPTYSWSAPGGSPSSGSGSSFQNSYSSAGSYAATVTATSGAQSDSASCAPVTISVPGSCAGGPTGSLAANPDRVRSGETTTLSWSGVASVDTSCVIRNSVNGSTIPVTAPDASCNVTNGSTPSPAITQQTTFTLRCDGVDVDSVTVNLLPGFTEF